MGAGQSDLYKGTYGDNPDNIPIQAKVSRTEMPNRQAAITPKEKFTEYSLNPDNPNAKGKAEAYKKGLGYDRNNCDSLIKQIENAVKSGTIKPYEISESAYGTKYKYQIPVMGANGNTRNVIAVYQIDFGQTIPRMITNYMEKK